MLAVASCKLMLLPKKGLPCGAGHLKTQLLLQVGFDVSFVQLRFQEEGVVAFL